MSKTVTDVQKAKAEAIGAYLSAAEKVFDTFGADLTAAKVWEVVGLLKYDAEQVQKVHAVEGTVEAVVHAGAEVAEVVKGKAYVHGADGSVLTVVEEKVGKILEAIPGNKVSFPQPTWGMAREHAKSKGVKVEGKEAPKWTTEAFGAALAEAIQAAIAFGRCWSVSVDGAYNTGNLNLSDLREHVALHAGEDVAKSLSQWGKDPLSKVLGYWVPKWAEAKEKAEAEAPAEGPEPKS